MGCYPLNLVSSRLTNDSSHSLFNATQIRLCFSRGAFAGRQRRMEITDWGIGWVEHFLRLGKTLNSKSLHTQGYLWLNLQLLRSAKTHWRRWLREISRLLVRQPSTPPACHVYSKSPCFSFFRDTVGTTKGKTEPNRSFCLRRNDNKAINRNLRQRVHTQAQQ